MSPQENRLLLALDHRIDADSEHLTREQIRLYRDLLTKYIAELSCDVLRNGSGSSSPQWEAPCVA